MATIEAEIYEEHAREAAFLWLLRDRAVRDVAYDLDALSELDGRLEGHLDGLRLGGDPGFRACADLLADAEGGEIFGAAVVAIDRRNLGGLARVLDAGGGAPDLARGLASALGWTPFDGVQRLLPGLLSHRVSPALTWLGIAACAAHRRDPGPALAYAILSGDARVRARALRAAGEVGRSDLLAEIRRAMRAEDEACRFWAAWSAALFGEDAAAPVLWEIAKGEGPFAERAAAMAIRRMDPGVAYTWVQALASRARDQRLPLGAAAALGDPVLVPWVIERMGEPETARLAGGVLTSITGVSLEAEQLSAPPPEGFAAGPTDDPEDDDVSMDPDESLPWPDAAAVTAWWGRRCEGFKRGTRYLLGQPMTAPWLEEVLRRGSQPARAAAAVELSSRERGRAVFEVRGPGFGQRRGLSGGDHAS